MQPVVMAICGGSGSGKSTLASHLLQRLGAHRCAVIRQDNYYRHHEDPNGVNFDHPGALDFELLTGHLMALKEGRSVDMPSYSFHTHQRQGPGITIAPHPLILLEGTLILSDRNTRKVLDDSLYLLCRQGLRWSRRLRRDVVERGRKEPAVLEQLEREVEPMHLRYVEPSRVWASHVVSQEALGQELNGQSTGLLALCRRWLGGDQPRADTDYV